MKWSDLVLLMLSPGMMFAFFLVFALFPKHLVRLAGVFNAMFYTDPWSQAKWKKAREHPEEFPRTLLGFRIFGCVWGILFILISALIIYGLATGRLIWVR